MHRERHALRNLEMDPTIPGQPKRLFRWLWEELDQQPGELVITHRELALELGRARSSVAEWMLPLKAAGLIRVRDQDTRRGTLSIQVFRPNPGPGWQPAETDRQIRLPLDGARREASTKPDSLSGSVDGTRHFAAGCRVSSTEPDTKDNILRTRASDDSDDEEEISSSSSLSLSRVDAIPGAIDLQGRLFPGGRPNLRHRDKVLLASAVVIAGEHGERGKTWLDESVELTVEHKPQKPVQYLKACLREGVATHLGRCALADAANEFGRMFLRVRPMVERSIEEYRAARAEGESQKAAAAAGQEAEGDQ